MITVKAKVLRSLREKSVGLIGKKNIIPVYFTTRWGIHTFGVVSAIDVLILDDNKRVVKMAQNFTPNRIFFWNPAYKHVLELPSGEIEKRGIVLGSVIKIPAGR